MIFMISLPVYAGLPLCEETNFPLLEDTVMASLEVISLQRNPQEPTHQPSFITSNPITIIRY